MFAEDPIMIGFASKGCSELPKQNRFSKLLARTQIYIFLVFEVEIKFQEIEKIQNANKTNGCNAVCGLRKTVDSLGLRD